MFGFYAPHTQTFISRFRAKKPSKIASLEYLQRLSLHSRLILGREPFSLGVFLLLGND